MHVTPELFMDDTLVVFAKLFLAMFLGGLIGTERSVIAGQPAGTRTFGLVALGSSLLVCIASAVTAKYVGFMNFDPLHVAAAVVTGIGFIGGGLIVFRGDVLHGSTTAAGLWVAAGVGIAVGYGYYSIAIFTTFLSLLMFTGLWFLENKFRHWFIDHNDRSQK